MKEQIASENVPYHLSVFANMVNAYGLLPILDAGGERYPLPSWAMISFTPEIVSTMMQQVCTMQQIKDEFLATQELYSPESFAAPFSLYALKSPAQLQLIMKEQYWEYMAYLFYVYNHYMNNFRMNMPITPADADSAMYRVLTRNVMHEIHGTSLFEKENHITNEDFFADFDTCFRQASVAGEIDGEEIKKLWATMRQIEEALYTTSDDRVKDALQQEEDDMHALIGILLFPVYCRLRMIGYERSSLTALLY